MASKGVFDKAPAPHLCEDGALRHGVLGLFILDDHSLFQLLHRENLSSRGMFHLKDLDKARENVQGVPSTCALKLRILVARRQEARAME